MCPQDFLQFLQTKSKWISTSIARSYSLIIITGYKCILYFNITIVFINQFCACISSSSFSRATASRKSIKLSEGLKISPLPDKHNKRSEIILPKSNEYQVVAIAYQHPIILERADQLSKDSTASLKTSKSLHLKAKIKLYAPSFGVAEVTGNCYC